MAEKKPTETFLTLAQRKQCLALGATMGEINEMESRGYEFADILELCQTAHDAKRSEKDGDADRTAKATKRAMRPENERHPAISVFSYPEGDVARPRPPFKCQMFWVAEELGHDLTTAEEIELLNQIVPGRYKVARSDGANMNVTVTADTDPVTGKPSSMRVWFDTRGFLRHNLPSRVAMCREIIAQQTPERMLVSA